MDSFILNSKLRSVSFELSRFLSGFGLSPLPQKQKYNKQSIDVDFIPC